MKRRRKPAPPCPDSWRMLLLLAQRLESENACLRVQRDLALSALARAEAEVSRLHLVIMAKGH